jgi:hypothetical protein
VILNSFVVLTVNGSGIRGSSMHKSVQSDREGSKIVDDEAATARGKIKGQLALKSRKVANTRLTNVPQYAKDRKCPARLCSRRPPRRRSAGGNQWEGCQRVKGGA